MNGFLLDTNVPSELSRSTPNQGVQSWLANISPNDAFLSVVTLGEIRKGFVTISNSRRREVLESWLQQEVHQWFGDRILPVTRAIAERWGELDGQRQLQGRPLNMADGLIAATALENSLTVVTRNVRDFDHLGVDIVNPWEL